MESSYSATYKIKHGDIIFVNESSEKGRSIEAYDRR